MARDHRHYVPILRAKQGEFNALAQTEAAVRSQLTPLIELTPVSYEPDDDEEGNGSHVDPSLPQVIRRLEQSWGTDRRALLDLGLVPSTPAIAGGRHPVEFIADEARAAGVLAVFVTGPRRDDAFQDAVGTAAAADGRGVCVRLSNEDFADLGGTIAEVDDMLGELELSYDDADLILDFCDIAPDRIGPTALAATGLLRGLPMIGDWRTLTLAATAFPRVADYGPNSLNTGPRAEWAIWQSLLAQDNDLPRMPAFGDYTVGGVQTAYEQSAAVFRPSPNLRYTTQDDYLVLKARHARHGHDQYNDLCRIMVDRPEYRGAEFSWGDGYIDRCAAGQDGPGNAMTWLKAAINHHLATVADQVASLP